MLLTLRTILYKIQYKFTCLFFFQESLTIVDKNVNNMLRLQALSRQGVISDWYLIIGNNAYIQKWSIAMCVIILMSSGIQVYFVRRLFSSHNVKSGGTKERAWPPTWAAGTGGGGGTDTILSAPSFLQFGKVIKTIVTHWISRSSLTCVTFA